MNDKPTISDMQTDLHMLKSTMQQQCHEFLRKYPGISLSGKIETISPATANRAAFIDASVDLSASFRSE